VPSYFFLVIYPNSILSKSLYPAGSPVRFDPDPENEVAVMTPTAVTPEELIVTAVPTIVEVIVVTPVITTPSGNVGELPAVLPLKFVTLKSDIRDLQSEGYQ